VKEGELKVEMRIRQKATVANYKYDPYGRLLSSSGTLANANLYRFSSKLWCANANLYYYGYRFYRPDSQRWLNQDPLGDIGFSIRPSIPYQFDPEKVEQIEGSNLYAGFRNSPIANNDAYGLACGSGWSEIFPDKGWFGVFDFTGACQDHDDCYGDCQRSKSSCDDAFYEDMRAECRRTSWIWKMDCYSSAKTYYEAVKRRGQGPYDRAQQACQCPRHTPPTTPRP
jgi:RHS repeat-associated protein